jgi:hypothetical protein
MWCSDIGMCVTPTGSNMKTLANLSLAGALAFVGMLPGKAGAAIDPVGKLSAVGARASLEILMAGKPLSIIPPGATRVRPLRTPALRVYG